MGHVYQETLMSGVNEEKVSMLVDTGATYSLIPPDLALRLGLSPFPTKEQVTLANGQRLEADIALVRVQIGDRSVATPTLIMECDEPLLGVEALEAMGLAVDPCSGSLKPTRGYALRLGGLR